MRRRACRDTGGTRNDSDSLAVDQEVIDGGLEPGVGSGVRSSGIQDTLEAEQG